jgi:uncharacterized phiE125 gp8 family phage protein
MGPPKEVCPMALLTLEELKTHLGITDTSQDDMLQDIVDAIDPLFKGYLGRDIELTTYTSELYDGPGTNLLVLNQAPIVSVTSVLVFDTEYEAVTLEERTEGTDGYYIKDADNAILYRWTPWPRGRGMIEVTYSAGYETIPADITLAAKIAGEYFEALHGNAGIRSEGLGSYSYSLASGIGEMYGELGIPDSRIKILLNKYRKKVIIGGY